MIQQKRWLAFAIGLLMLLASCSPGPLNSSQTANNSATDTTGPASTVAAGQPDSATPLPRLSPQVLAEMQELEEQVVSLRGLALLAPVERQLLSPESLEERILEDFLDDYSPEEAADDARLLNLFGMIPPDFDLWNYYRELYSEQIAGYYDDEVGILYIVADASFTGPERLTYVHEFGHALQDQHFDLDQGLRYNNEDCELESERCAAVQALIEGDASLLEEQWLRTYATQQDFDELVNFYGQFQSPAFDKAPPALKESLLFPYRNGLDFVRWYFQQDGWASVDALFAEPPVSTEMILHPLLYPEDHPVQLEVSQPDPVALGPDWRLLDQGTLGELDLQLLLAEALPGEDAAEAAAGWAGDTYLAYYNDELGVGAWFIVQRWDTIRDAQDTYLTWRDYGEARFGPRIPDGRAYEWESDSGFARLELASNQTLWLVAPDADTRQAVRAAIQFPAED